MSGLNNRERSLVALGAALASNCVPCIEYHIPDARRVGLSEIEIGQALQIADKVRQVPARAVMKTALARIETAPDVSSQRAGSGCGCAGSNQTPEVGGVS